MESRSDSTFAVSGRGKPDNGGRSGSVSALESCPMAEPAKKLNGNAPGEFYVDSSCIDCDLCRQIAPGVFREEDGASVDRKSTRLNSSHSQISYAVFCLKKKREQKNKT